MRALIVNGDDFGLTRGVNAGIMDAHTRGILTSTSLFANAAATDDAIALARETPTLGVGCHLTLVDGTPVLPDSDVPTLAAGGRFRASWRAFVQDALCGRILLRDVERELAAQIERLTAAGLRLTHLDSHKHVHAYPPVFRIVARLARAFDIQTVRVPYEAPAVGALRRHVRSSGARRQALQNIALGPWSARDRRLLDAHGLPPAPAFLGRVLTGVFTRESFHAVLERVPPGSSELMMHPGYSDAALERAATRLRRERAEEVALLTDPAARALLTRARITLTRHDGLRPITPQHANA
jgi:chitin disaccharide deacetylase